MSIISILVIAICSKSEIKYQICILDNSPLNIYIILNISLSIYTKIRFKSDLIPTRSNQITNNKQVKPGDPDL